MVIIMLALMVTLAFRQGAHQYASPMDWVMEKVYILPGIICFALYPTLANPDEAYMTMVKNLFPVGMVGLVLAVLTAALVSTIGSALNALSTVFTMDIYVKKFNPKKCYMNFIIEIRDEGLKGREFIGDEIEVTTLLRT
jgi:uncharacterized sodium:solute symporter family permease YidK